MKYKIISATSGDVAALAHLVNSAYRGDVSRQGWTTEADLLDGTRTNESYLLKILADPDHQILLYKEAGELSGCMELHRENDKMYLGMLTVRPDLQGQGIGKTLLYEAENYARAASCKVIFMTVISERQALIAWYLRHGYTLTGERKPFTFTDPAFGHPKKELEFVLLEKRLPAK